MAEVRKLLGRLVPAHSTTGTAYQVASQNEAIVSSLVFCNRAASAATLCAEIVTAGEAGGQTNQYIYSGIIIPANDTFVATIGMTLSAGDQIRINPSNDNLTVLVFGVELTP